MVHSKGPVELAVNTVLECARLVYTNAATAKLSTTTRMGDEEDRLIWKIRSWQSFWTHTFVGKVTAELRPHTSLTSAEEVEIRIYAALIDLGVAFRHRYSTLKRVCTLARISPASQLPRAAIIQSLSEAVVLAENMCTSGHIRRIRRENRALGRRLKKS